MTQKKMTPAAAPIMLAMNCSVRTGMRVRKCSAKYGRSHDEMTTSGMASRDVPMG